MAFSGTFDSNGYPIDPDTNEGDTGWHICDGTNGTPDLRGRFILGASDSHAVGSTGGEENHTLTIEELPSRTLVSLKPDPKSAPTVPWNTANSKGCGATCLYDYSMNGIVEKYNQPHNNMPPYYALSYIMKV